MTVPRVLAPALGAITIIPMIINLVLDISFAATLKPSLSIGVLAIISSIFWILGLVSVVLLTYQEAQESIQKPVTKIGQWPRRIQAYLSGLICIVSDGLALATFIWMHLKENDLPQTTLSSPTHNILTAAFALWALSCVAQLFFLVTVWIRTHEGPRQTRASRADEEAAHSSEMRDTSRPATAPPPSRGKESLVESPSSTISGRKRSGSDTVNSIRSSFSQVVRPISSKTRLVVQKTTFRPPSLDSGTGEREIIAEDGFDSWDTSGVDTQSWQTVMAGTSPSPGQGRVLETIPASPTVSRSPSPGHPLDLQPPQRARSRSHSPATSLRTISAQSAASESHIHPLFRSDSPTPPPTATPGTVVTAAPGGGLVIATRRSVQRMRSGSLPNSPSPLAHSDSMSSIEQDSREDVSEASNETSSPPEREMTPPIPDWVLGAGSRNSLSGYSRRKLGPVGETREH